MPARRKATSATTPGSAELCAICLEPMLCSVAGLSAGDKCLQKVCMPLRLKCGHSFHIAPCLARYVQFSTVRVKEEVDRLLEQRRLVQQVLPAVAGTADRLRQCPRCGYGPVLNRHCGDLQSHDRRRGPRGELDPNATTNECGNCHFYSDAWSDWEEWSPTNYRAVLRCPLCRSAFEVCSADQKRLEELMSGADDAAKKFASMVDLVEELRAMLRLLAASNVAASAFQDVERKLPLALELPAPHALALLTPLVLKVWMICPPIVEVDRDLAAYSVRYRSPSAAAKEIVELMAPRDAALARGDREFARMLGEGIQNFWNQMVGLDGHNIQSTPLATTTESWIAGVLASILLRITALQKVGLDSKRCKATDMTVLIQVLTSLLQQRDAALEQRNFREARNIAHSIQLKLAAATHSTSGFRRGETQRQGQSHLASPKHRATDCHLLRSNACDSDIVHAPTEGTNGLGIEIMTAPFTATAHKGVQTCDFLLTDHLRPLIDQAEVTKCDVHNAFNFQSCLRMLLGGQAWWSYDPYFEQEGDAANDAQEGSTTSVGIQTTHSECQLPLDRVCDAVVRVTEAWEHVVEDFSRRGLPF